MLAVSRSATSRIAPAIPEPPRNTANRRRAVWACGLLA